MDTNTNGFLQRFKERLKQPRLLLRVRAIWSCALIEAKSHQA